MDAEYAPLVGQCRVLRSTVPETDFAIKDVEFSWSMVTGAGGDDCCCCCLDDGDFDFGFE